MLLSRTVDIKVTTVSVGIVLSILILSASLQLSDGFFEGYARVYIHGTSMVNIIDPGGIVSLMTSNFFHKVCCIFDI